MINVRAVSKSYGQTCVVDDVSIHLPACGLTSIIGPNGAGKSTLLSMISRLMPLDRGQILVDGLDVATTKGDVLARRLSILKQDNHLTTRLTVHDLVAFGRYPYSKGRLNSDDARHIDQALDYLNLTPLSGRFLDELSGGQRQRAFVAMVLCQDTDYVLFDEPLNNLDTKHAVSMMKLLKRASSELGKTVVVVLHDINFAAAYCDHIVAMKNGRVFRQGSPDEIIQADVLEEIYETSFQIFETAGQKLVSYYL